MSFDIFLQCFRSGQPKLIRRAIFDSIFASHDAYPEGRKTDPGYMVVEYPDGSGASIYCGGDDGGKETSHMMFNHCGGDSFWADLYRLADHTQSVIFWPAILSYRVFTKKAAVAHLPKDFLAPGDIVRFIRSGAEIPDLIDESFPEEAMKKMYGDFWLKIAAVSKNKRAPEKPKAKRKATATKSTRGTGKTARASAPRSKPRREK